MQAVGPHFSICPTFNHSANGNLAEIAARVTEQCDSRDNNEDSDFAFVTRYSTLSSPIPADEIFHNGKIRPIYPDFNRNFNLPDGDADSRNNEKGLGITNSDSSSEATGKARNPLRKLLGEERKTTRTTSSSSSSSSSSGKNLAGFPKETYYTLRPKESTTAAEEFPRPKKSGFASSTSSQRWRFTDLLHRGSFVFPSHRNSRRKVNDKKFTEAMVGGQKSKSTPL